MRVVIRSVVVAFVFLLILVTHGYAQGYEEEKQQWGLFLDGRNLEPDVLPINNSVGVSLPIRFVIEGLGGEIEWFAETKEVKAKISQQELYILFKNGIAEVVKLNGVLIQDLPDPVRIVSGRTMIDLQLVEKIVKTPIRHYENLRLVHVDRNKNELLGTLANEAHKADEALYKILRRNVLQSRIQLEHQITKHYSKEIASLIIEHYYRRDSNLQYRVIPTEGPMTMAPVNQIYHMEAKSIGSQSNPSWVLSVKRKPSLFSTHWVHSQYEFRQQNKQWIIVEIIHQLVDNRERPIEVYGGGAI